MAIIKGTDQDDTIDQDNPGVDNFGNPAFPSASPDSIEGFAGDDTLSGLGGGDHLFGGEDDDYLDGGAGEDTLEGGNGDDEYVVDTRADEIVETSGVDTIYSFVSWSLVDDSTGVEHLSLLNIGGVVLNLNGTGNAGNNRIQGNAHDNILDGGGGADTLRGFLGNDTYVTDGGDTLDESDDPDGVDTVMSRVSFTLGSNFENLVLQGSADINGTGNTLGNAIQGNSGNNTLNGGGGADRLYGLGGNDTYVTNGGDTLDETNGGGVDTVQSTVSFTLGAGFENLRLIGSNNVSGTGNAASNILTGNAGTNTLTGGDGRDVYVVQNAGDTVVEGSGINSGVDRVDSTVTFTLSANVENLTLLGTASIDGTGNAGANILTGNAGINRLTGGDSNDVYVVQTAGDTVVDSGGAADRVESTITWSLSLDSNGVENLTLFGAADINGFGSNGVANLIIGNTGANRLSGGTGADTLAGRGGADTITGGSDADIMRGEEGDDIFLINTVSEHTATEQIGGGANADEIRFTAASGVLVLNASTALVETVRVSNAAGVAGTTGADLDAGALTYGLTLIGDNGATTITGTVHNDDIFGLNGDDVLDGAAGVNVTATAVDTMTGGDGSDVYLVQNANDRIIEGAGVNSGVDRVESIVSFTLAANVENLTLFGFATRGAGNASVNTIIGTTGANTLDGRGGADILAGLWGDDFFFVDDAADQVIEGAGQGTGDRVFASVSYALGADAQVERLSTTDHAGTAVINLIGNDFVNTIFGNAGANTLDGRGSADSLIGFGGNDFFFVDNANDAISEGTDEGTGDRVFASVNYTLGAGDQVEIMSTTNNGGLGAIDLSGNEFVNTIFGNAGSNVLNGKGENDTLVGFGGADFFLFDTALNAATNVDRISGFSLAEDDTIRLENAIFTALTAGALSAAAFRPGSAAADADDRIIYNGATGALFYDADGIGGAAQIQFAIVSGAPALTNADFFVV